ncbi:T9SS type A sorting domain-containing protein [Candidatus Poribacteria bacterium]|nr:T9SS type A sorting domain-containing protein [Candidatus Poribacteria bacterium]
MVLYNGTPPNSDGKPATPPPTSITEWKGEYWNNQTLSGNPILVRNDDKVDFDWGNGGPGGGVPNDHFSARWTRQLYFTAGHYCFHVLGDDGVRLYVDNNHVAGEWKDQSGIEYTGGRELTEGHHSLKVEYYENGGDAKVALWWDIGTCPTGPEKIKGPWLWMIAPTDGPGGAVATDADQLAKASGGAITEEMVARNDIRGDRVGNLTWVEAEISATGINNIQDMINQHKAAWGGDWANLPGDINDHSAYALIIIESSYVQSEVTARIGSDDSIKVWLNGQVVHKNAVDRGAGDFQDTFKMNLNAGDNLLLVKVSEHGGDWSMFVGIQAQADFKTKTPVIHPIYSLTTSANPPEGGNVDPSGTHTYDAGTQVLLTANPIDSTKYRFKHWSGDASGSDNPITITMDKDKKVIANFIRIYPLTTSVSPSGSGRVSPSGGTYDEGTTVSLTAAPSPNYRFYHWSGDASGTSPTITITMDKDKSVIANFKNLSEILTFDLKPGWSLISFPGTPVNPNPDSLTSQSSQIQRLFTWDLERFAFRKADKLEFGKGYWVLSLDKTSFTVEVIPTSECVLSLKAGWNLIGSPNATIDFTNPQDNPDGSVLPPARFYDPDKFTYTRANQLEPTKGYWVIALQDCTLTLKSSAPPVAPSIPPVAALTPAWTLPIKVTGEADITQYLTLGAHAQATEGFDRNLDEIAPPPVPQGMLPVQAYFPNNHPLFSRLTTDIKPLAEAMSWRFQVEIPEKPATLSWDASNLPGNLTVILDTDTDKIDMRTLSIYLLPAGTHQLTVTIVSRVIPKVSKLLQNYPNPFNPETWIPYNLAPSAVVTIKIYDVTGQLVKTLHLGQKEAGVYQEKSSAAYWNGTNDAGEKVASGVYFYTLEGGSFRATKKLMVLK